MMRIAVLVLIVLCGLAGRAQENVMNFSGTIWNGVNPNFLLIQPMVVNAVPDTILINADGSFAYAAQMEQPTYLQIIHGKSKLILFMGPGLDVKVALGQNWQIGGQIIFETGGEYNEYLMKYSNRSQQQLNYERQILLGQAPGDFFFHIDSIVAERETALNTIAEQLGTLDENFGNVQNALNSYWQGELMLTYTLVPKTVLPEDSAMLNDRYTEFFNSLPLSQPGIILFDDYYNFLVRYVDNTVRNQMQTDPSIQATLGGPFWATYDVINSLQLDQSIKDLLYYRTIEPLLMNGSISDIVELLQSFGEYCTEENYISRVSAYFNYWMQPLIGSDVPDLGLVDLEGNTVGIAQFAGNYIYIDVWATWCGPCKKEIPYLQQLGHDLEGKNIVFLGVSTDKDKAKWENFLTTTEMHGTQVHAGAEFKISTIFQVASIPRFIIIDPDGKVFNPRAPRPSTPATKNYLLGLEGI